MTECSNPTCRACPNRRRRRELVEAGMLGGAIALLACAIVLVILEMMK